MASRFRYARNHLKLSNLYIKQGFSKSRVRIKLPQIIITRR